ncbi:MAG: GrpB family protein [Elusimicrobiota bacterium]
MEATCWEEGQELERMEIIEIGAVKLDGETYQPCGEYASFVRPVAEPVLSEFCRRLTSIRQQDVDSAAGFKEVLPAFMKWVGEDPIRFCTWSTYDLKQLKVDCARHGLELPRALSSHIDLRQLFAAKQGGAPRPMEQALIDLGLPLDGVHHRALDDSRNIAKIAVDIFTNKKGGHVEIVEYDPAWPGQFAAEQDAILAVLGDMISAVEHVGSTALPGVAAKPTIDLMVGVDRLDVGKKVVAALADLGYSYFGEFSIPGRHFFRKGTPPTHHVHWVEITSDFWDKQLLFRDYMRAHPADGRAYEEHKKKLAAKFRDDRDKYTLAKTEFIEEINRRALAWRAERS